MTASRIYHEAIKDLAAAATGRGELADPDGKALADNPLCGDRVGMEIRLRDGRIVEVAHRVRGCLLCEAAAAAIAQHAPGADAAEIELVSRAVADLLEKQSPPPAGWTTLAVFAPVHGHRSRYRCVQLPFEALLAALRSAVRS